MSEGRILAASEHGAYVIRMEGDVRLTLSTTIDEYFQRYPKLNQFFVFKREKGRNDYASSKSFCQ